MKKILKYIVAGTYKPLLEKYLAKTRVYRYQGIILAIPQQVFHPGFFSSTKILLGYIRQIPLGQKKFLELGAGSGLISIFAFKKGAFVTASDINPVAIEFLEKNCRLNQTKIRIIHSDLFKDIPSEEFDIIAINPPYYKKQPLSNQDYAWNCGENGEYFARLFNGLPGYLHSGSVALLILCDGCDLEMIRDMAATCGFKLDCVFTRQTLIERNFIFQISYKNEFFHA